MKRALQLILSLAITVGCMLWAFRGTNLGEQINAIRAVDYRYWLIFVLSLLGVHVCRTLRWGCLLSGMERVPFKKLNEASAIGFMMLIVLPFRLGELARPFLVAQRSSLRRSPAMMTVVLERIVDGVTIAVLLRVLLFFVHTDARELPIVKVGANMMFLVFGGGLCFLLFGLWQKARAAWLIRRTVGSISPAVGEKVVHVVENFVGALEKLPSAPQAALFFFYTAIYWGLNGVGMWILSFAFQCVGAGSGCQPLSLPLLHAFVVLCVLVVGMMIPAAPGNTGTYQAFIRIGLGLFLPPSVVTTTGLAFANVLWFSQVAQQIILGLIFQSASTMSLRDVSAKLQAQGAESAAPSSGEP
jgi:uncharacterized membrane protein YbhN (UPF0104 family)